MMRGDRSFRAYLHGRPAVVRSVHWGAKGPLALINDGSQRVVPYLVAGLDPVAASGRHRGQGMHVAVRVSDIEAEHALLAERGVEVSPVQRQPWGEPNFSFKDPDGYLWEYGQPA